jgi:II/X family phage/plasmid replication protein
MALRPTYAATYHRWKDGVDVRHFMSQSKFYLHRAELMKYGIDISVLPDDTTGISNVVPLIRVLEAKPVKNPDWAYSLKLVHK